MNSALLLIDIQNDYFNGGNSELFHSEEAANNASHVLTIFRKKQLPVFHVQHINNSENSSFFKPNTYGVNINKIVAPFFDENIIIKHVPNSFYETNLQSKLLDLKVDHLVICGMMSHMCVDTTVRAAKDFGFSVTLLHDACTTKDLYWNNNKISAQVIHDTFMASLNGMFANVISSEEYLLQTK